MRHIREVLRLKHQHKLSTRQIARSCGLPASTVGDYVKRAKQAGLSWPLPEELSQGQLQERLLENSEGLDPPARPLPDWEYIRRELRRKSVTLRLLWQEYQQAHPQGYGYSRFCELYQRWAKTLDPSLRQHHEPGQKMFVDWAGQTVPIQDPETGQIRSAHLFVTVLGASNKVYVEAFENEQLPAWISGHCHAFAFYQGVAALTIPDNPKAAVLRPCRYEPGLNKTYGELAEHFGTVILPARVRKPKDKASVESGVLLVERQILAALRDHTFFSLAALNQELTRRRDRLNAQPFQKLEGSRDSVFEAEEKPALKPLPEQPYQMATWSRATVNIDYHAVVDNHFYSVPNHLIHKVLEVRSTEHTVELFYQGQRVAAHARSFRPGKFTTLDQHRPKAHQRYLQWTPGRMIHWAQTIGPCTARMFQEIFDHRPHPEQGFRSCLGLIRLARSVGNPRLEAACRRALHFGLYSYRNIKSILETGLDQQAWEEAPPTPCPDHPNVRGRDYYT